MSEYLCNSFCKSLFQIDCFADFDIKTRPKTFSSFIVLEINLSKFVFLHFFAPFLSFGG